jgi:hypothetical protein
MKFTLWATAAPLAVLALSYLLSGGNGKADVATIGSMIGVPWLFVGCPAVVLYWIVRLVRRAAADGRR